MGLDLYLLFLSGVSKVFCIAQMYFWQVDSRADCLKPVCYEGLHGPQLATSECAQKEPSLCKKVFEVSSLSMGCPMNSSRCFCRFL